METIDLEGINFERLVKNRTIDTFPALMWYLAGRNFGRFVRNKTNDNFVLQKQNNMNYIHKRHTRVGVHVRTLGNDVL